LERIIYYKFNEYNEKADERKRIKLDKFSKKSINISNPIYTQILTWPLKAFNIANFKNNFKFVV